MSNEETNKDNSGWLYNEFKQAGVDYDDAVIAEAYDKRHTSFRDYERDARMVMERLDLKLDDAVLDLGCGTGAFVIPAARFCREVYAVDVSQAMLDLCRAKAEKHGLDNIEFHRAGFLTYEHMAEPVDAVVSSAALHHLPDFWKAVALKRIYDMLKPGGRFFLFDVVFSFPVENYFEEVEKWLAVMVEKSGELMAAESKVHIRDEYSTFEWIMDGMLERAGLDIVNKYYDMPCCMSYVCEKSE